MSPLRRKAAPSADSDGGGVATVTSPTGTSSTGTSSPGTSSTGTSSTGSGQSGTEHKKGKVTPKRSAAQAARKAEIKGATPKTRKEASAQNRTKLAETREAMKSTDVAKLPANERYPELVLTRDLVDSRLNLTSSFLPVAFLFLVVTEVTGSISATKHDHSLGLWLSALTVAWFVAMLFDAWILGRLVRSKVLDKYPDSTVPVRWYAARRAFFLKRFRRPVVRVSKGADPWGRKS